MHTRQAIENIIQKKSKTVKEELSTALSKMAAQRLNEIKTNMSEKVLK